MHEGSRIASNDLRLKLIRKRQLKRSHDAGKYSQKIAVHPTSSRSSEAPMSYRTPSRPSSSSQYNDLRPPTYPEEYASGNGITYSSQFTVGGSRRARSPDRISRPTRELSPPRISSQAQRIAPLRAGDLSSSENLIRNVGVQNAPPPRSWLTGSSPLIPVKHAPPQTSCAAVPRVAHTLGTTQHISQKLHEHVTVADFLHSLELGKYCISFQAEEVDMAVLKQMGEKDLKDMGIPMGPRKKILLALLPPPKKS
ncbi:unnamed protein product [Linum tenue]|uniref:SAM domain-containing protein n=1 Tax=Linum tenue TaxID=586396 RepID=A0AAV0NAW5_9ROSI|nr:unnamed protein product [Linum tenue]